MAMFIFFATLFQWASAYYRQVGQPVRENYGLSFNLEWVGEAGPYGPPISPARCEAYFYDENTFRIKIVDPALGRWEVPGVIQVDEPTYDSGKKYNFEASFDVEPFTFKVYRLDTPEAIWFSTSIYFSDQYIELSTQMEEDPYIYGLGERVAPLRLENNRRYMIFNTDHPTPVLKPLYGAHPMYMQMRDTGAHGVYLLNSNAMDAVLESKSFSWKTVGGVADMWIFLGPHPEDVLTQYHRIIGTPFLPPAWSLGYHQCRWGYDKLTDVEAVVEGYRAASIPLETMWIDIDHMDNYKVFTLDPVDFPDAAFSNFVDTLHSRDQTLVLILDPGLKVEPGYETYESALESEIYIFNQTNDGPALAKVWPEVVVFPDYTNPNTPSWWDNQITTFYTRTKFDGLWVDMNELASFCDGRCTLDVKEENGTDLFSCVCSNYTDLGFMYNQPPYMPGEPDSRPCRSGYFRGLDCSAVDMISHTAIGLEYNTHNIQGHLEAKMTAESLEVLLNKRPFVLSRSTFTGTGHYVGHWLGDNHSTWEDLVYSIAGMITMQIFGIPMVGADICGFMGDTNEELCIRWSQLGAFYPFARNHNDKTSVAQEPYIWGEPMITIQRHILAVRYSLNAYYYSLFHNVHIHGGSVIRPLFFLTPYDRSLWANDRQFVIGDIVMVCPVLASGASNVECVFPGESVWYWYHNGQVAVPLSNTASTLQVAVSIYDTPMFIRGGSILVLQEPKMTTKETRLSPMNITVAFNAERIPSSGFLYLDSGDSIRPHETKQYTTLLFDAIYYDTDSTSKGDYEISFNTTVFVSGYQVPETNTVSSITFLGVMCDPKNVGEIRVNDKKVSISSAFRNQDRTIEDKLVFSFEGMSVSIADALSVKIQCYDRESSSSNLEDWEIGVIVAAVVVAPVMLYIFWIRQKPARYAQIN